MLDITSYKVCDIFKSSNSGLLALSFPCLSAILDKWDIIGIQAYSSKVRKSLKIFPDMIF